MRSPEVDTALTVCRQHLTNTNSFGTEIEAFLTRYMLVVIYGDFERTIKRMLVQRAAVTRDRQVESFIDSAVDFIVRRILTSEIAGILGKFDATYKRAFQARVNGTRAETFFNNIVTNRHSTAHGAPATMTYRELESAYNEGHAVLDEVQGALSPTL